MVGRDVIDRIEKMAALLPKGSTFEFETAEDGSLWLERLYIPPGGRGGAGKRFFAELFHACDLAGLECRFTADATDEPGDPVTHELVNFYRRLGAVPVPSDDGWPDGCVGMHRPAADPAGGVEGLLAAYELRRADDLSVDDFELLRNPSSGSRRP